MEYKLINNSLSKSELAGKVKRINLNEQISTGGVSKRVYFYVLELHCIDRIDSIAFLLWWPHTLLAQRAKKKKD